MRELWRIWRGRAAALRHDALTAYFIARDPALPWRLRLLALALTAYVFSPIDLIPDVIPVLGWLDELLIVPLVVRWVLRHAPSNIVDRARARAARTVLRPVSRVAAAVVVLVWAAALYAVWRQLR